MSAFVSLISFIFIDFSLSVVGFSFRCRSSGSRTGVNTDSRAICGFKLLDGIGLQNSAQTMASSSCASGAVSQRAEKSANLDPSLRIMEKIRALGYIPN